MLRRPLLYLSHAGWVRRMMLAFPPARHAAARFVAGQSADDAARSVLALNALDIDATVDHLGENVTNADEATRAAEAYINALDRLEASGARANVSLKLTQFGLDLSQGLCADNVRRVLLRAQQTGNFVRVDMEGTPHTDRTLELVRALRRDGFRNLGAVLQAYLYRTEADLCTLMAEDIPVRLCKGAYDEPPEVAFPRKADVDANYVRLSNLLLEHSADAAPNPDRRHPPFAAIATHDPRMIEAAKAFAASRRIPRERFEFQMLYGIRRESQARLATEGYRMRVYVPYGTEWYPYFMRRLAERPANLWFLVSSYFAR